MSLPLHKIEFAENRIKAALYDERLLRYRKIYCMRHQEKVKDLLNDGIAFFHLCQ
jgi:hypothetical protein